MLDQPSRTLAATVVLLFNDHVGKALWPGAVTGRVSDFAGLVVVLPEPAAGGGAAVTAALAGPVLP